MSMPSCIGIRDIIHAEKQRNEQINAAEHPTHVTTVSMSNVS